MDGIGITSLLDFAKIHMVVRMHQLAATRATQQPVARLRSPGVHIGGRSDPVCID